MSKVKEKQVGKEFQKIGIRLGKVWNVDSELCKISAKAEQILTCGLIMILWSLSKSSSLYEV